MRGRWAEGIEPRNLIWVLRDRLAICERPGGSGANHRAVRRTEEIIWIRRRDFNCIVSLLAGPHNLHSYDREEMPYLHLPLGEAPPADAVVAAVEEVVSRLEAGERLLMHHDRIDDALAGFLASFLLWMGRYREVPPALHAVERLLCRPIGRRGRETVLAFADAGATRGDRAEAPGDGGRGDNPTEAAGGDTGIDVPPATPAWRIVDR